MHYYTGLDLTTCGPAYVVQHLRDLKLQRALLQFLKTENYLQMREVLRTGR